MSDEKEKRKIIREGYGEIAKGDSCGCGPKSCCGSDTSESISQNIGYSKKEMKSIPQTANLGLGCGNPVALASLKEGEIVLDLGSGAGMDAFLAANRVGESGKVIGVDMTPEMLERARKNAEEGNYSNVEFREGIISDLPVDSSSIDIVISNCVINLSPSKPKVFEEMFRVLKPGGRMMVSDIVLEAHLPDYIVKSQAGLIGCISGAVLKNEYLDMIKSAGFSNVKIVGETRYPVDLSAIDSTVQTAIRKDELSEKQIEDYENSVVSVKVEAWKE